MKLEDFLQLPEVITADESQLLNKDLSTRSLSDIPKSNYREVENYLCNVLINNSVESDIKPTLESLLEEIRASQS